MTTPHTASRMTPADALAATPRDIAGWTLRPGDRVTDAQTLRPMGTVADVTAEPIDWNGHRIPCAAVQWDGSMAPEVLAADTLKLIAPGAESRAAAAHARRSGA